MREEQKVVFGVSPTDAGADVLLGITAEAWEYMKDGHTHTFDLTKLGLPIRLIMYGGPDRATVRGVIDAHNKKLGIEVEDQTDRDFSV